MTQATGEQATTQVKPTAAQQAAERAKAAAAKAKEKEAADKAKAAAKAEKEKEKEAEKARKAKEAEKAAAEKAKAKAKADAEKAKAKAEREAARAEAGIKDRLVPADLSKYTKTTETKTAGGNASVDRNDKLAQELRGADLDTVYTKAAKLLGELESELRAKYAHLNAGMQRMNLGNRMRAAQAKGH